MGCEFDIEVADIDESVKAGESPKSYGLRVATAKAQAICDSFPDSAVLAADTIVSIDGEVLGKPRDLDHALQMWQRLADGWHDVISVVVLAHAAQIASATVVTGVRFATISTAQMRQYWQTGEPADKAGGYAIQGRASAWVQEVRGSYSNVVGLPLFETNQLLHTVGHNWL